MTQISDAPNGDLTTVTGSEKIPVSGDYYTTPAEIQAYTRDLDNCYILNAGFTSSNPADASTYYFGWLYSTGFTGTATDWKIYILRAGTIVAADLYFQYTNGSNENSTFAVRLNNTTDYTLSSTIKFDNTPTHSLVTGLSIAVAAGDYLNIKWTTPTWVTDPTNVNGFVQLFIK